MGVPKLTPEQEEQLAQAEFNWLVPYRGPLLNIAQVQHCLGYRSHDFVLKEIELGRLESHKPQGRERAHRTVTKRSVLLWLLRTAEYEATDFRRLLDELLCELDGQTLDHLIRKAMTRRAVVTR